MTDKIIAYKGFDKHLVCNPAGVPFQYEIGKTYSTSSKVVRCAEDGFHSCEYPLDIFAYYPPGTSRYARVIARGRISRDDSDTKVASSKITIEEEVDLPTLVASAIKWIASRYEPGESAHVTKNGLASVAAADRSASSATGDKSASSATGICAASCVTGDESACSATGDQSVSSATGNRSGSAAAGFRSISSAAGDASASSADNGVLGKESLTLGEIIDAWNAGQRWFDVQPNAETVTTEARQTANPQQDRSQTATDAAKRTRPKERIVFKTPIVGPSGAKLTGYQWMWTPEAFIDSRGEEVMKRVSDWDEAITSTETGRDVVHQFSVEVNGEERIVSAESAIGLLGYADGPSASGFKSIATAAKTLARQKMQLAEAEQARAAWQRDWDAVAAMRPPEPVRGEAKTTQTGTKLTLWSMDGASIHQQDHSPKLSADRFDDLVDFWRDAKMRERGWKFGTKETLNSRVYDLKKRIARGEKRLAQLTDRPAVASNGQPLGRDGKTESDRLTARLDSAAGELASQIVTDAGETDKGIALFSRRRSAQNDAYETDLFGTPVPATTRANRAARSDGAGLSGDVQSAATVPGDTDAPAGEYLVRTIVGSA